MSEMQHAQARFDDWLHDAPLSCLSPLLDRLAIAFNTLEAVSKKVQLRKEELVVRVNVSNEQFQATVAKLIAKLHASYRIKLFQPQHNSV